MSEEKPGISLETSGPKVIGPTLKLRGTVWTSSNPYGEWVSFRPQGEPGSEEWVWLSGDANMPPARRELYWAGQLDEQVAITVLEDQENPGEPQRDNRGAMTMTGYRRTDERSTAEKVADHPSWQDLLPRLRGLMQANVLSAHQREISRKSLQFVEAHEVIMWQDGSITTVEHSAAGVTGAFTEQRMLPPLTGAGQLIQLDPWERPAAGHPPLMQLEESIIDYGAVSNALERVLRPAPGRAPPTNRGAALRALRDPVLELAARVRAELRRRIAQDQ